MSQVASALDPALLRGDPVAWTRALIAIPSVNPDLEAGGRGEGEMADFLRPYLDAWGFRVRRTEPAPGRVCLVAHLGDGSPTLALCGHLDTVGVEGMSIPPFGAEERGGRLHGRGAADMKSGLAAILCAAAETAASGGPGRGTLALVFTADEENASLGLRHLLDGGLTADGVVVAEPTELAIAPASKGFLWLRVQATGRAAHGSRPDSGRDAIRQVGRVLAALDTDDLGVESGASSPHPLLGRGSLHAGTIRGGVAASVYPASCTLVLEARLLPGQDADPVRDRLDRLLDRVEAAHPGVPLAAEMDMVRPGAELGADSPLFLGLAAAIGEEGLPVRTEGMSAWVESAWFMEAGIPALCFGPGSIGDAHTSDESVAVDEIRAAARVLSRLVRGQLAPRPPADPS
ncbi:MAG: M20 family peptidase [Gemmatimonadales bacterium]|nr:MAG: M20 family peptidase [Gemmatimonadales bacterium]